MIHQLSGMYGTWSYPPGFDGVELDLGCGKGGFTMQVAKANPRRLVLGADVMIGRLRRCEKQAVRQGLDNLHLLRANATDLIPRLLPDASLLRLHVLCPDPWPKAKHRGNRLITSEFLGRLAMKLQTGGALHLATDNVPYLERMLAAIAGMPQFERDDTVLADLAGMQTDFEKGFAKDGIPVTHLGFRRR